MRFAILIHSHPDPWGHPTSRCTPEGRAVPDAEHEASDRAFDVLLEELSASGELVTASALGDPADSTVYRWGPDGRSTEAGPYPQQPDRLAGWFVLDCASRDRAEEVAAQFAAPGDVVELRPVADVG